MADDYEEDFEEDIEEEEGNEEDEEEGAIIEKILKSRKNNAEFLAVLQSGDTKWLSKEEILSLGYLSMVKKFETEKRAAEKQAQLDKVRTAPRRDKRSYHSHPSAPQSPSEDKRIAGLYTEVVEEPEPETKPTEEKQVIHVESSRVPLLKNLAIDCLADNLLLYEGMEYIPLLIKAKIFLNLVKKNALTAAHLSLLLDAQQKTLVLNGCSGIIVDDHLWSVGEKCPLLETLNVARSVGIKGPGLNRLLLGCHNLVTLNLEGCKNLDPEPLNLIGKNCSQLKTLNLAGCNKITSEVVEFIIKRCTLLEDLNLNSDGLINPYILLTATQECVHLTSLDMSNIGHALKEIASVTKNPNVKLRKYKPRTENLKALKCLYNGKTFVGYFQAILEASGNKVAFPNLEVLEIGECGFNDSLRYHAPNLKSVRLDTPQVSVYTLPPSLEHLAMIQGCLSVNEASLHQQLKTLTLYKVLQQTTLFDLATNLEEVYLFDMSIDVIFVMKILKNNRNLRIFKYFGKLLWNIPFEVGRVKLPVLKHLEEFQLYAPSYQGPAVLGLIMKHSPNLKRMHVVVSNTAGNIFTEGIHYTTKLEVLRVQDRDLDLKQLLLPVTDDKELKSVPSLKTLELSRIKMEDELIRQLGATFPNLTSLSLLQTPGITHLLIGEIATNFHHLEHLSLKCFHVLEPQSFKDLKYIPTLEIFETCNCMQSYTRVASKQSCLPDGSVWNVVDCNDSWFSTFSLPSMWQRALDKPIKSPSNYYYY